MYLFDNYRKNSVTKLDLKLTDSDWLTDWLTDGLTDRPTDWRTQSTDWLTDCYNNANCYLHLTFLNEEKKILQDVKRTPCEAYLFNFHQGKII